MKKSFIKTALKNMRTTGAVSQSSSYLIKSLLKPIDFSKDLNILELGPGPGNVTKSVLSEMNDESMLHSFEINDSFFLEVSKIQDPRLRIYHISAEYLHHHLEEGSIDVVISTLPLANFNKELKDRIFGSIKKVMASNSLFVQFQYSLSDYRFVKREFDEVDLKLTVLNLPPAFVYVGQKK